MCSALAVVWVYSQWIELAFNPFKSFNPSGDSHSVLVHTAFPNEVENPWQVAPSLRGVPVTGVCLGLVWEGKSEFSAIRGDDGAWDV